jgi:four helix bundle protein
MGSSFELETQVMLAFKFNYIKDGQLNEFEQLVSSIQKMSFGLYKSLEN